MQYAGVRGVAWPRGAVKPGGFPKAQGQARRTQRPELGRGRGAWRVPRPRGSVLAVAV